jgi:hypothetical protein
MSTIDSFYNPDEHQAFEYHRKLLNIAEQERLAHQVFSTRNSYSPSKNPSVGLKERFLRFFSGKPGQSTLA